MDATLAESAVHAGSVLLFVLRAHGGVMMEPTLQVLARKYNCDKLVCRKYVLLLWAFIFFEDEYI